MRSLIFMVFLCALSSVRGKGSGVRPLTESMGQEVIEIGAPVKDLPQELDEEPSAEVDDDDDDKETTVHIPAATKKEAPKVVTDGRRKMKDIDMIDNTHEDEESRIEKEIAEIYKDTDYKSDSSEVKGNKSTQIKNKNETRVKETKKELSDKSNSSQAGPNAKNSLGDDKPIARTESRSEFKFSPDRMEDMESWRTSEDVISCAKRATKMAVLNTSPQNSPQKPGSAVRSTVNTFLLLLMSFLI